MLRVFHALWFVYHDKIFNMVFIIIMVIALLQVLYRLIVHKKSVIIWIGIMVLLPAVFSLSKKYLLVQTPYQKIKALLHGSFTNWMYATMSFAMMLCLVMVGYSALVNLLDKNEKHTEDTEDHKDDEEESK